MTKIQSSKYTTIAIILHWVIAILLIGQIIGGFVMHSLDATSLKYELFQLHKSFGIVIFLLSFLRLVWRLMHKAPKLPDTMKAYEKVGANLTHIGFYALMIGIPISGWIMISVSTTKITTKIFKTLKWPNFPFVPRSEALENIMKDAHELLVYSMIALLLLHVGAALKHHFIKQDDVLTRMVPRLKRKGQ